MDYIIGRIEHLPFKKFDKGGVETIYLDVVTSIFMVCSTEEQAEKFCGYYYSVDMDASVVSEETFNVYRKQKARVERMGFRLSTRSY